MDQCPGVHRDHYTALELFLDYLRSRRASDNPRDWPSSGDDNTSPTNTDDPAALVPIWRSHRRNYPGWVILPEDRRLALWLRTQRWTRNLPTNESLPGTLDLAFAFELAWRMEKCLCPLLDDQVNFLQLTVDRHWPPAESTQSPDDQTPLESHRLPGGFATDDVRYICHYLILTLMRHYREEGSSNDWRKAHDRLHSILTTLSPEHLARLHYERALFALFSLDLQELTTRLADWPRNDALPFWAARKAALLAEIGRVDEAQRALSACGKSRRLWLDQIDRVSYT